MLKAGEYIVHVFIEETNNLLSEEGKAMSPII
jgi:hypothetical protein